MADTFLLSGLSALVTNPTWISVTVPIGTSDQIGGLLLTDDDIPETLTLLSGAGGTWLYVNRENPGDFGPTGLPEHLPGTGLTYTAPTPVTTSTATDIVITAPTGLAGGKSIKLRGGTGVPGPAAPGGVASLGGGSTAGNGVGHPAQVDVRPGAVDGTGGAVVVHGGTAAAGAAGGDVTIRGGYGDDENTVAGQIVLQGGQAAAAGLILVYYNGVAGLPTSDPAVAGALWSSTGTVKVSAG